MDVQSAEVLWKALDVQPKESTSQGGGTREEEVYLSAKEMLQKLPVDFKKVCVCFCACVVYLFVCVALKLDYCYSAYSCLFLNGGHLPGGGILCPCESWHADMTGLVCCPLHTQDHVKEKLKPSSAPLNIFAHQEIDLIQTVLRTVRKTLEVRRK